MGSEAVVIGGLIVLGGLVVLWHLTFSVDPRVHPHPFVLRWVEPRWERWEDLDWDAKMRIFHRRQVVNWVFVILVVGLLAYLFSLALRSVPPQAAGSAAVAAVPAAPAAKLAVDGEPFGVAVTPDGKYAIVALGASGDVALYSRPGYKLVARAHVGGQPCGIALTEGGKAALVAVFARQGELVALSVPALKVLARVAAGAYPIEVAVTPDGRQAFVSDEYHAAVAVVDLPAAGQTWPAGSADSIPVDLGPVGLAVSPNGKRLYVTCEEGTLLAIDTATDRVVERRWVGSQAVRVVLGDAGRVAWVTVRAENELKAFNAQTLAPLGQVAVGTEPVGLALIDGGAVAAVADSARFAQPPAASTVTFVSTAAVLAGRPALLGTVPGGKFPREFALSPHGRQLLLTEFRSDKVAVFDVRSLPQPR